MLPKYQKGDFKVIYINFIYKGSQVQQECCLCEFNETNKAQLLRNIESGVINKPENYEKVIFTEFELSDEQKIWYK